MSEIFIDGTCAQLGNHRQTWADLLGDIDAHLLQHRRVLTAVRFDGVELPTFREPSATMRPLAMVQRIELETASPRTLVRDSLRDGAEACREFVNTASGLATLFRQGELATAGPALAALANDMRAFVAFVGSLRQWIDNDATLQIDGKGPDDQIALVSGWVESLIAAHGDADWLTVADILEYDLEPFLGAWRDLLAQLASRLDLAS